MEGIFYRTADGREVPIKEVEGLTGKGTIIIQTACMMRPEDTERVRKRIEEQIGGHVVVLDASVVRVMRLEE